MVKQKAASVIIPNWNGKRLLGQCLDALSKQTYKDFEIIVVENGSTDGSVEYIEENYPEVVLLKQKENLGFAGGVNVGLKHSQAKYKILLNNDTAVDESWLGALVHTAEKNPNAFAVVSKILEASKRKNPKYYNIDSTGDQYSIWGMPFPRGRGEVDTGQFNKPEQVFAACGGSVLYRATLLEKVGLFDEDFFAYYEDVDISFRARLMGYDILYEPKSVVYHAIGATSGGGLKPFTRFHSVKNAHYLYLKNMPASLFWRFLPRFLLGQIMVFASSIKHGLLLSHLKGLVWVLLFLPKKIVQRVTIQRKKKVSNADVLSRLYKELPPLQKDFFNKFRRGSK
ncbi:MAG: hypothetical protein QG632_554 [Candidatus Dependentiae bacterium]|nr:hypothetical protein [Candidatus Dependentiae bacterium]